MTTGLGCHAHWALLTLVATVTMATEVGLARFTGCWCDEFITAGTGGWLLAVAVADGMTLGGTL